MFLGFGMKNINSAAGDFGEMCDESLLHTDFFTCNSWDKCTHRLIYFKQTYLIQGWQTFLFNCSIKPNYHLSR